MRPINSIIALSSGASFVSAYSYSFYPPLASSSGPPRQHTFNESDLNDLHKPNYTNSVNFTIGGEEWTWRVNITDLSVPDARKDLDTVYDLLPDPRVAVTTFDLQWPLANETLNETAIRLNEHPTGAGSQSLYGPQTSGGNSSSYDPICMTVIAGLVWPNVTNKLQDSDSGDCEAVLGQDCIRSLLAQTTPYGGACKNLDITTSACQGVFGGHGHVIAGIPISHGFYHDRDNFTTYYSDFDDPKLNISYLEQVHVGDALWFSHSHASPRPNNTVLRQAESQLRIMFLTLPGGNSKAAVCTRVDPSIDDEEVSVISQGAGWDEGGNGNAGSSGDDDESAASPRFAATVGSVGFVGLAVAVFGLL